MSKIWESLKALERATRKSPRQAPNSTRDRRCGPRTWPYAPVLVYGRTVGNEPFHEATEVLRANAAGGLITLTMPVRPGQPILLINRTNQKEQQCRVVGYRGTYLERSAIGFEFLEPVLDFWDVKQ